jgi:mannose-6-phosphate isomerase-like protein (cupin superfamily)
MARQNQNFRTAFWTGDRLQMTLMSIPPCGEIGAEMHPDTEQFIRVEEGERLSEWGSAKKNWTSSIIFALEMRFLSPAEHGIIFSTAGGAR